MQTDKTTDNGIQKLEAVVAIFESDADASRVAASLHGPDLKLHRVSRTNQAAADEMPDIVYDEMAKVDNSNTADGMLKGGAIGAGSGLLLLGVPGLNVLAPIVGAIAGAWIGGIAGIDEAVRNNELPNQSDYRRMLSEGKSFVVIAGDEPTRIEYAVRLEELGAIEVHQHPPVHHAVRTPRSTPLEDA